MRVHKLEELAFDIDILKELNTEGDTTNVVLRDYDWVIELVDEYISYKYGIVYESKPTYKDYKFKFSFNGLNFFI